MALDFAAIESAIAAWLAAGTGLPAADVGDVVARVVPRNLKVPQPPLPYLDFLVPPPNQPSGPDELRRSYDAQAPAGSEVVLKVRGERQFVCSIRCFTEAASGGADFDGKLTARAYLSACVTAIALPSVRAALNAAGLGFVSVEGLQDLSERAGPIGQGRGSLDVRFRCVDTAQEATGYIQAVTGPEGTLT